MSYIQQREKARQEQADRIAAGTTQALSPWTRLQAGPIERAPGQLSSLIAGGAQGFAQGQAIQNAEADQALRAAQLRNLEAQTSMYGRLMPQQQQVPPVDQKAMDRYLASRQSEYGGLRG